MLKENKNWIEIVYFFDLTKEQQEEELDYNNDAEEDSFFEYNETIYSLSDFMRIDNDINGYHGVFGLTNTSAMLIKFSDSFDCVQIAISY